MLEMKSFGDAKEYLEMYPDIAGNPYYSKNPREHYDKYGKKEGRNWDKPKTSSPAPGGVIGGLVAKVISEATKIATFVASPDEAAYLKRYPDIAGNPYYSTHPREHYDKYGRSEGRTWGTGSDQMVISTNIKPEISNIKVQEAQLKDKITSIQDRIKEINTFIKSKTAEILSINEETKKLKNDKKAIEGEIKDLETQILSASSGFSGFGDINSLNSTIKTLESLRDGLEKEVVNVQKKLDKANFDKQNAIADIDKATTLKNDAKNRLDAAILAAQSKIQELPTTIEELPVEELPVEIPQEEMSGFGLYVRK